MNQKILKGTLLDEQTEISLEELCRACSTQVEWVSKLVYEGVLEPVGKQALRYQQTQWRFTASSLQTVRTAVHLQRDLGIDWAGIALALELLEKIDQLEARLQQYEGTDGN